MAHILPAMLSGEYRDMLTRMREEKSPFEGRVPPLNTLRAFEAAARLQSFVRAAEELHVTHGAVSRQVKQLEATLGVDLFERRNRAVFRTPQGTALLEACSEALGVLGEAVRRLRAPVSAAPLVVSCEPTLAMRWLIPRTASTWRCAATISSGTRAATPRPSRRSAWAPCVRRRSRRC
jgi:hypothetical protein